ncbi:peptidase M14 [Yersinia frederiksenii]|uniref:peptidase M14 n=1 Tax=Yersinia frederiksenii TaxID=29484 RepID=UPI000B492203|nr:peptidase M14 [Yersinia frederiksenii]OWF73313.1 peptidase M14 [Yersinia frederiksenii]
MAVEWVDVVDNAVKIGMGSVITFLGGWLTLKRTQQHEVIKGEVAHRLIEIDKKTERYIDFLSHSQSLMQKYLYTSCDPCSDDYIGYMRLHNIVTITSTPEIRLLAFETQDKVSHFILVRKPNDDIEIYRHAARNAFSLFQGAVSAELLQDKAALQNKDKPRSGWLFLL